MVIHPDLVSPDRATLRSPDARLAEAVGLTEAIGLTILDEKIVRVKRPRPATLFGSGAVEDLAAFLRAQESLRGDPVDVVVVDGILTPIQQRNLERGLSCKVIDRTGLILEIFGDRAQTKEGRLQVELAALTYARSRLVRSWTHLERQRGGLGFVGGPGETQIESDRRIIGDRITRLRGQLRDVVRTRDLHRKARKRLPTPVVALVGYTNAGKSTLFNRLTQATVFAQDQLFATLDPTMRALNLPSGRPAILSDTVGFISDLPHELVAAFRATLEEVREADLILHVRDIAHPDTGAQRSDVLAVMKELDIDIEQPGRVIEVLNKTDCLDDDTLAGLTARQQQGQDDAVLVSAKSGAGEDDLLAAIDSHLWKQGVIVDVDVEFSDGALLAWLYDHGDVVSRDTHDTGIKINVRLSTADAARLEQRLAGTS